jgi:hypothetical protein
MHAAATYPLNVAYAPPPYLSYFSARSDQRNHDINHHAPTEVHTNQTQHYSADVQRHFDTPYDPDNVIFQHRSYTFGPPCPLENMSGCCQSQLIPAF